MKTLTLGNYRHTVTVIRSLASAGYEVIVGRDEERTFTQFSRHTSEVWDHPKVEQEREFIDALANFLKKNSDIAFVFPIGETFLECIARNLGSLPPSARFIMPNPATLIRCLDKAEIHELVHEVGIPVPGSARATNLAELAAAAAQLGYPCIVKPNHSFNFFFNQKAIICGNAEELEKRFSKWPAGNECLVIQRYIAGYRPNCHFAARNGFLTSYFEHNVIRTDRLDETGFEVDGISVQPTPVLRKYCEKLIHRLDYTGVGCVQFLADAKTGDFYFLEINPRLDATCALPFRCGYDFPRMAVDSLGNSAPYPIGRRAYWLLGDIQGLVHGLEDKTVNPKAAFRWVGRSMKALAASDLHLTFSVNDPKPTAFLYYKLLASLFRRLPGTSKTTSKGKRARSPHVAQDTAEG